MHDVVKLPPAGFLPLVAARINFEHIARLRREVEKTKRELDRIGLLLAVLTLINSIYFFTN